MKGPADRRITDPVVFFHDKDAQAGARQIGGGGQAVMACTGNDHVI
jgi:hypothetical protein